MSIPSSEKAILAVTRSRWTLLLAANLCLWLTGCDSSAPETPKMPEPDPGERQHPAAVKTAKDADETAPHPAAEELRQLITRIGKAEQVSAADWEQAKTLILTLERDTRFATAFKLADQLSAPVSDTTYAVQLNRILDRLRDERRAATGLDYAVRQLDADHPLARDAAVERLLQAGETGRIYLRHVVRQGSPEAAAVAAATLRKQGDMQAIRSYIDRLLHAPHAAPAPAMVLALRGTRDKLTAEHAELLGHGLLKYWRETPSFTADPELMQLLYDLADRVRTSVWQACLELVLQDDKFARLQLVDWLAAAWHAAGADPDVFDDRVGQDNATAALTAYVRRAIDADQPAVITWALHEVAAFHPYDPGVWGEHFNSHKLRDLAHETKSTKLDFRTDQPPFRRNQHLAARWTGLVKVREPGTYTFYATVKHAIRIKLAGTTVIEDWATKPERSSQGTLQLEPGLHPMRIEFYNRGGTGRLRVEWSGPGFERRVLGKDALRCSPAPPSKRDKFQPE